MVAVTALSPFSPGESQESPRCLLLMLGPRGSWGRSWGLGWGDTDQQPGALPGHGGVRVFAGASPEPEGRTPEWWWGRTLSPHPVTSVSLRNQRSLPRCALCIWPSQPRPGTGLASWARHAVCGFILAWIRVKCAWRAWDGLGGSAGAEVSRRALQTLAETWGENSPRHCSSLSEGPALLASKEKQRVLPRPWWA